MTVKDQNLQEFKASYGDRGDLPDPVATPSTGKLNGAHKDALEPAPKVGEAEPVGATGDANKATLKPKSKSIKEEVAVVFEGSDLSEDFIDKASTIFEAAVNSRVAEAKAELTESMELQLQEAAEALSQDLQEQISKYLDYVVESWLEDNKLAVESNIRTDIAESFIQNLKQVFVEHYVDVPEEQVNVVESLSVEVDELTENLNEAINVNMSLVEENEELKRSISFAKLTEGMTAVEAEKLKTLSEGVTASSIEEYETAVMTIKESYLTAKPAVNAVQQLSEAVEIVEEATKTKSSDPFVNAVASSLSRTLKN